MFSFDLNGKKYTIGNLELDKDTYYNIKQKLLGEIVDKIKQKKPVDVFRLNEYDAN